MAISSLSAVISGLQPTQLFSKLSASAALGGYPLSAWGMAGLPAAGSFNTVASGGTWTSPVTGAIPHFDPPGGTNSYLARFQSQWATANSGMLMLCDRLWDGRLAINDTTNQTVSSVAWPARDVASSTNGDGVLIGIEVAAGTSTTAAVLSSYTYTNQSGTTSRTGVFIDTPTAAAAALGRFYRLSLQAGDTGVRSVQNIQFSTAWTTGTINLVAYRVLSLLETASTNTVAAVDAITSGFPQIFNGTVPFLIFMPSGSAAPQCIGHYIETQG